MLLNTLGNWGHRRYSHYEDTLKFKEGQRPSRITLQNYSSNAAYRIYYEIQNFHKKMFVHEFDASLIIAISIENWAS